MKYVHFFSGVNAPEYAASKFNLPMDCLFTSEIDENAIFVQKQNFPDIPCHDSIQKVLKRTDIPKLDLVIAGTSCQSFSVASPKGDGLDGKSGVIAHFWKFLAKHQPEFFIWENVASVVNFPNKEPKDGRYRASYQNKHLQWRRILNGFTGSMQLEEDPRVAFMKDNDHSGYASAQSSEGYNVAWIILDAAWSSPQSRKRVYMIGSKTAKPIDILLQLMRGRAALKNDFVEGKAFEGDLGFQFQPCHWKLDFHSYLDLSIDAEPLSDSVLRGLIKGNKNSKDSRQLAVVKVAKAMLDSPRRVANHSDFFIDYFSVCFDRTKKKLPSSGNFKFFAHERLKTPCLMVGGDQSTGHSASKPLAIFYRDGLLIRGRTVTPEETEALMGFPRGWTTGLSDGARRRLIGNSMSIDCIGRVMEAVWNLDQS